MKKELYALVLWPESQQYMDYEWFDEECYSAPITGKGEEISAAYFIPYKRVKEVIDKALGNEKSTTGKCPVDGRQRPVYIIYQNKRVLAIADGKGDAYKIYTKAEDGYPYMDKPLPENKYDPDEYEFDRGLSGMDY